MSYIVNSITYYVNSRNRINGDDSNFCMMIPIPAGSKYTNVCVLDMSVPKSYYLIQDGYNTFTLVEGVIETQIGIPPGNYSRRSLQANLITLLNTGSPNHWIYQVTYPNSATQADTGKFTFTVSGNSSQPSINCTVNVFEVLGFNMNSTNVFIDNSLTSTNVIKLQLEDTLFLHSDMATNGHTDILASIYSDGPDMSIMQYKCTDVQAYSKKLNTTSSNYFHFSLLNEDRVRMNTNGLNITFTLLIYSKDNIYNLIRDTIHESILAKEENNNIQENPPKNNSIQVL